MHACIGEGNSNPLQYSCLENPRNGCSSTQPLLENVACTVESNLLLLCGLFLRTPLGLSRWLQCCLSLTFPRLSFFFKDIFLFYFFLAVVGLCFCTQAFSSCSERGLLFLVFRILVAVASLVVEHRLQAHGLQQLQHVGSIVSAYGFSSAGFSSCGMYFIAPRHVRSSWNRD